MYLCSYFDVWIGTSTQRPVELKNATGDKSNIQVTLKRTLYKGLWP